MSLLETPYSAAPDSGWKRTMSNDNITNDETNEILEHYEMFKAHQEGERRKIQNHTFKNAIKSVDKMIAGLEKIFFSVQDVYLRFNNSTSMTVLMLVDDEIFLSDEFDAAYELAKEIECSDKNDIFDIDFTFAAKTDNILEEVISSQGFLLKRANSKDEHAR
jgi:hypothetical protein